MDLGALEYSTPINIVIATFTLSGFVRDSRGYGVINTTVTLTGGMSVSTTTNTSGYYRFNNILSSASYTITPSKTDNVFTPNYISTVTLVSSVTYYDFTAHQLLDLSGYIRNAGAGVNGVTVTLSGDATRSTTTWGGGYYQFKDLPADGSFTVIPQKAGYAFQPPAISTSSLYANATNYDFSTLTGYAISGFITDVNGIGIADVSVQIAQDVENNSIMDPGIRTAG